MGKFRRGSLFVFLALAVSCRKGTAPDSKGEGEIRVVDIDGPRGLDGPALSKCDHDGSKCSAIAENDAVAPGTLVKTAPGARASFALGASASLDLGEAGAVFLASSSSIEVTRGSIVLRKLGSSGQGAEPVRIDLAGRTAEIDRELGGTVLIRAKTSDRAAVTVEKGKLAVRSSGGQAMVLLSGETVDLTKGKPPERSASFVTVEPHRTVRGNAPILAEGPPRGLGRMTARVPGHTEVVSGVSLISHSVDVVLRDGLARTEVEEVFQNDTSQVLEGRYVFPLPSDASISRLALWVNDKPVEGEIVEKKRAAVIFKSIVEDTVRPRDPALLEWVSGGDFSLKIFPLPAKGNRKVRITYDQVLAESGGRVRYVYPLSAGAERGTQIDDFTVRVRAADTRSKLDDVETPSYATSKSSDEQGFRIDFGAKKFTPANDFIVSYARLRDDQAEVSAYVPSWGEFKGGGLDDAARGAEGPGYFALRVRADLPAGMTPAHLRRDRAIVIDTSHSQSKETLESETKLAYGLAGRLDADERFAVLACDSACVSYPESGLAFPTEQNLTELGRWLSERSPSGSSDVAGALLDAARRLEPNGAAQLVYVGDGSPTSGELSALGIGARIRSLLGQRKIDLRFLGAGRTIDEVVIGALAEALGGAYEPVATGESMERRIADLALSLRSPVIRGAQVELPSSFIDVYPRTLRNLRLGEQVVLVGRLVANEPGQITLRGDLDGQRYVLTRPVSWTPEAVRQNPLVPRLWSLQRMSDLERSTDPATARQVIDLSKRYHVMSRYTSLLVLENDAMFAEFGIKRTSVPSPGIGIDQPLEPTTTLGVDDTETFGGSSAARRRAEVAPSAAKKVASASDTLGEEPPAPVPLAATAATPLEAPRAAAPAPASPPTAPEPKAENAPRGPAARDRPGGVEDLGMTSSTGVPTHGLGALSMGRPAVNMRMEALQVTAGSGPRSVGLPTELVARVLRTLFPRMRACYQKGLLANPMLSGRVAVRFVIGQTGDVLSVMDGGSHLADASVIACVLLMVRNASFPTSDAGFVTASFLLRFSPGDSSAPWLQPVEPTAVHRAADDGWLNKGESALEKLRTAVEQNPTSRKRYEDLVRGLLSRGRFEEALATAKRFVSMDPDLPVARELLAYALVANDDPALAAAAVDTQTETDPNSIKWHVRGARAFEALGDERRACAHWRSLAELSSKSDEFAYEAFRCRARILDDHDALLQLRSVAKATKLLADLALKLEAGAPPAFTKSIAGAGQFEAEVTCSAGERCPTVFVVSPLGNVFSPFTPTDSRSSARSVAVAGLRDGTYTTLLTGGSADSRGEVELRTFGSTKRFPISHGGRQTVATTRVTLPAPPRRIFEGFGIAF